MFTVADIRHIAIQIEKNGEESYRKAAAAASDPQIAELFTGMADDEMRHARWFESIESKRPLTEEQREMEAAGKAILQEMVKDRTFSMENQELNTVASLKELLLTSQGFEQDTILFYEMLCGFIDGSDTLQQLHHIIAEEKRHLRELKQMAGSELIKA